MKSTAIKISKNSLYGTFGKPMSVGEIELYCEHCYCKIEEYFMNNPLGCFECVDGLKENSKFLTKGEMRNAKINDLDNE